MLNALEVARLTFNNFLLKMADIFTKSDAEELLRNKTLWLFGDSNVRGLYKDLLWLLEKNTLIHGNLLKGKLEKSFMNDKLIKGSTLHKGRDYQEVRFYKNITLQTNIQFTFLTQCYAKVIQDKIRNVPAMKNVPDVIVINSCLWDMTRWGPDGVSKYKSNIIDLLNLLKQSLPSSTKVIWITTPPISKDPRGGFFIKQIEFLKHTLRFDVMEANTFVSREFMARGFDVLDIHYHLLLQIHRRRPDGIHWCPEAMRHITNLLLTHICLSWNLPLPGNFKSPLLNRREVSRTAVSDREPLQPIDNLSTSFFPETQRRGKKRDIYGNVEGRSDINFALDVFDYDYKSKKFKLGT